MSLKLQVEREFDHVIRKRDYLKARDLVLNSDVLNRMSWVYKYGAVCLVYLWAVPHLMAIPHGVFWSLLGLYSSAMLCGVMDISRRCEILLIKEFQGSLLADRKVNNSVSRKWAVNRVGENKLVGFEIVAFTSLFILALLFRVSGYNHNVMTDLTLTESQIGFLCVTVFTIITSQIIARLPAKLWFYFAYVRKWYG